MQFLGSVDFVLFFILIAYNSWNWFLAMSGHSMIEYLNHKEEETEFNFKTIRDNLYRIFGTLNLIQILSPSLRNGPFVGIEWSFQLSD